MSYCWGFWFPVSGNFNPFLSLVLPILPKVIEKNYFQFYQHSIGNISFCAPTNNQSLTIAASAFKVTHFISTQTLAITVCINFIGPRFALILQLGSTKFSIDGDNKKQKKKRKFIEYVNDKFDMQASEW